MDYAELQLDDDPSTSGLGLQMSTNQDNTGGAGAADGASGQGVESIAVVRPVFDSDRVFALFDVDRDGILDVSDFKEMLRELGIHAPQPRLISALLMFDDGAKGYVGLVLRVVLSVFAVSQKLRATCSLCDFRTLVCWRCRYLTREEFRNWAASSDHVSPAEAAWVQKLLTEGDFWGHASRRRDVIFRRVSAARKAAKSEVRRHKLIHGSAVCVGWFTPESEWAE